MLCGAYCLAYVHRKHGMAMSVTRARKLARTDRDGTSAENLVIALKRLKYRRARLLERISWRRLVSLIRSGNDVFVLWWSVLDSEGGKPSLPDGHWSVAVKADRDTITIYDPDPEMERTLPRKMFEGLWYSYEGEGVGKHDLIRSAVVARFRKE